MTEQEWEDLKRAMWLSWWFVPATIIYACTALVLLAVGFTNRYGDFDSPFNGYLDDYGDPIPGSTGHGIADFHLEVYGYMTAILALMLLVPLLIRHANQIVLAVRFARKRRQERLQARLRASEERALQSAANEARLERELAEADRRLEALGVPVV